MNFDPGRTLISLALVTGCALAPPTARAAPCAEIARQLKLPNVTFTLSEEVAAGAFKLPMAGPPGAGPPAAFGALPAFCRVAGTVKPSPDSDIRFEVWLPAANWNGKFVGVGNGVWAGSISYGEMVAPLSRGYATAATDDGHQGNPLDGTFLAGHPQKLLDFGYRAPHEMTVAAKATVAALYGKLPQRSLFVSCSTGGRQGLMQAHRFPEDYDGISSMAPANPMVNLMVGSLWTGYVALKDEGSRLTPAKLAVVKQAALQACDANDGAKDGIITDPRSCRFDVSTLACKSGDAASCLTPPQVAAVRAIYAGAKNPRTGQSIYPGFAIGSESMLPILTQGPLPFPVATTYFQVALANPGWDFRSFDYDKDVARALAYGSDALDVPPTGLDEFFRGNRKLLLSHGWADGLIPAQSTLDFHAALVKDIGAQSAAKGVRLFMVPGMGHCAGGDGPSSIDVLGELDRWVASGTAPQRIVASNPPGAPPRTRPLCAHPQVARYSGSGSTDDEQSFRCEAPR